MVRYFIHLAYHGGAYHGWQVQPRAPTVQQTINEALGTLLRHVIEVVGCGRTDTGVHASSYYAHFDVAEPIDAEWLKVKLNSMLPADIAVYDVFEVTAMEHARFSAVERSYTYSLHNRKDPFLIGRSVFCHYNLDLEQMNKAGTYLCSVNDFASFCKAGSNQKTTLCTLIRCHWHREGHRLYLTISADRFLRNMVRSVVGTSIDLGRGKINLAEFKAIVASGDRGKAGTSAPAHGLCLSDVRYSASVPRETRMP